MGPLTITRIADPPRLEEGPTKLNSGASMASVAARTIERCSGRQPAITAFAVAFSILICLLRSGISPSISEPSAFIWSRNWVTLSTVGGITGRPSVHPKS